MTQSLLLQPLVSGEFGYLRSKFVLGNTGTISLGGTNVNKNLAIAVLSVGSAVIVNVGKDYIIPKFLLEILQSGNCTKGSQYCKLSNKKRQ
jgi:hypothetical protein